MKLNKAFLTDTASKGRELKRNPIHMCSTMMYFRLDSPSIRAAHNVGTRRRRSMFLTTRHILARMRLFKQESGACKNGFGLYSGGFAYRLGKFTSQ